MTKISPQVSIGMPVYNGEPFIREALDSLLAQTFTDFELIISDNASTDQTESICQEYVARDQRVRYVRQSENRGALANFQFVLDEAVGEYFMWAAADDRWDCDWINQLLPVSSAHQCLAYGHVLQINDKGQSVPHPANGRDFSFIGSVFFRRLKYFFDPAFLGKPNPIYGLMPKRFLTQEAFTVLESEGGSDMLFLFNLLRNCEIRAVNSVCLDKRIDSGNLGGKEEILNSEKRDNKFLRVLSYAMRLVKSHATKIMYYSKLSSAIEVLAQIFVTPLSMVREIFSAITWRYRV